MPIVSKLALALTLTGSVAFGLVVQAHAESPRYIQLAQYDDDDDDDDVRKNRDLRPVHKGRPRVSLTPNAKVIPIGSWLHFRISSSITGYAHLYVMSASGRAQVWMENVPIVGGYRLKFPVGPLGIKAAPPPGREDLMLIVTRKRIKGFFGYRTTRRPTVVDYGHESFKAALTAKFRKMPKRQWNFARTSVRVVDRSTPAWGWGKTTSPYYWDDQFEDESDDD